ncbi:MAG: type II toxin-antitoxin system tRNA(fMet)-specific endonuclease VapC [Spirochaetota bacterium]
MKYFLDTNICIYYLKGLCSKIKNVLLEKHPDEIKIAAIVKAELLYGAEKSENKKDNILKVNEFLFPFEIVPFNDKETHHYSKIRTELERKGTSIGPNDLLIASIVLNNDGILVTNNENEFRRIKGLKIENWTK